MVKRNAAWRDLKDAAPGGKDGREGYTEEPVLCSSLKQDMLKDKKK